MSSYDNERWVKVKGCKYYEVSDHGRVRSLDAREPTRNRVQPGMMLRPGGSRYAIVTFNKGFDGPKAFSVHRLVANAFVKKHSSKDNCINHKNGDIRDNHYTNLEWVTHKANTAHAILTGIINMNGENHPNAKLTYENVLEIRNAKRGTLAALARKFGVYPTCVYKVRYGTSWLK